MKIFRLALGITLAIVAMLALAPAAQAQTTGQRSFDLYAGYNVPGLDDLDNDLTYGIGFTSRVADQWGWGLTAGYMDLQGNNTRPLEDLGIIGAANGYFVDANGTWYVAGSDFGIFAGIGFGSVDVDLLGTTQDVSDDAFTYNYGVNYTWNFGDSYLLKPQVKWRKWDGDTYEKTDNEYTLAFGWRF